MATKTKKASTTTSKSVESATVATDVPPASLLAGDAKPATTETPPTVAKAGDVPPVAQTGAVPPVEPIKANDFVFIPPEPTPLDEIPGAEAIAGADLFPDAPPAAVVDENRGRGRPAGSKNKVKLPIDYNKPAAMIFDCATGALTMAISDEWKPRDENERAMVVGQLAVYLESKDVGDIPPGILLAIVCMAYAGPRFRQPKTVEKLKLSWVWIKSKMPWGKKK